MDVVTLIFLSFVFRHVESSTDSFHRICPESWRLDRSKNDDANEVSFTNRTLPGNYTLLLWQWNTNNGNCWDTYLWTSYQNGKLIGKAVLRRGSDRVVLASVVWKRHNATLEWSYSGGELDESDWTISFCPIADWSFTSKNGGEWMFQLGDVELYQPHGREKLILDSFPDEEFKLSAADNQISEAEIQRKYMRLKRSRVDKENFVHSNATPAEKWEIVQAILDRVFGNSEDIRRNGWVSHLNIFNILGRIFGLDQIFNRSPLAPTTTESSSATEPDAESVNTNFLRRFPGARIKSKKE